MVPLLHLVQRGGSCTTVSKLSVDIYIRCQNHEDVSMAPAVENKCIFRLQRPLKALSDRSGDRSPIVAVTGDNAPPGDNSRFGDNPLPKIPSR